MAQTNSKSPRLKGPYVIGGDTFRTQDQIKDRKRAICETHPVSVPLTGADHDFVQGLLDRHPNRAAKAHPGIAYFTTGVEKKYGHTCLWVVRTDQTAIDIGMDPCITGKTDHKETVRSGMRLAIRDQIDRFRRTRFGTSFAIPSDVADEDGHIPTVRWGDAHVDHEERFEDLADLYADSVGGYENLEVTDSGQTVLTELLEPHLSAWQSFHHAMAKLRIVTAHQNLSALNSGANRRGHHSRAA